MTGIVFEVDPSLSTSDDLKFNPSAYAAAKKTWDETLSGPLSQLTPGFTYLSLTQFASPDAISPISSKSSTLSNLPDPLQNAIQTRRFSKDRPCGQIEFIFDLGSWSPFFKATEPGKKYASMIQILQYPFSRGSIHISSRDASKQPVIDPAYYQGAHGEIDLDVMTVCADFAQRIPLAEPLSDIIVKQVHPPPEVTRDEARRREWVVDETITDWHPVGTCAMVGGGKDGEERGGVVDERLRVYGVRGLRVADASIMPLQLSTHLQATCYAIGEKAADMILEDLEV